MNRSQILTLLEYLSLAMILSYILVHNIFVVLIGIFISLYLVNKSIIDNFRNLLYKITHKNQIKKGEPKNFKANTINLDMEDSRLTLAETIEELGFIPSIDNNIDSDNEYQVNIIDK